MNITLNPELEQLIQSQLTMGEYNTIEDLLKEALINLLERKKHQSLSKKVNNLFAQTQSLPNKQEITEEDIIAEIEAYRRGE